MSKVILTDCDGVLLDWFIGFKAWMIRHGYKEVVDDTYSIAERFDIPYAEGRKLAKAFNESAAIAFLKPWKDAVIYTTMLHLKHGYVFDVITSQTLEPAAQILRIQNLETVFGKGMFRNFIILDTGADKDEALAVYKDSGLYWIEDKPENAELGLKMGLKSVLVEHNHNVHHDVEGMLYAKDWKSIYTMITGETA